MYKTDSLGSQALLYANGEMAADEATAFEQRLGEDQSAREALAQAVALSRTFVTVSAVRPNTDYRVHARRRLLPPPSRTRRRTAALCILAGAVTALLLLLLWIRLDGEQPSSAGQVPPPVKTHGGQPFVTHHEFGRGWAAANGNEADLVRANREAQLHKSFFERRRWFTHWPERPTRFAGPPAMIGQ